MTWSHIPEPLEWHPFYRNRTYLLNWVEGRDAGLSYDTIQIPIPNRRIYFMPIDEISSPEMLPMNIITMTRQKCWGLAPYVGEPFVYIWWVGVDNLGRMIAGDARIEYTGWPEWYSVARGY